MMSSQRARTAWVVAVLALGLAGTATAAELDGPVSVVYDQYRVPTIIASTEHDAIFFQGYMHAKDRFWQMDFQRRVFSGQSSELVGPAGLANDVQLRTLGLRRSAERSLPVQTPEVIAWLEAYSAGVNAWLADSSQSLPLEYAVLEIDKAGIPPWTPLDSLTVTKGLAFQLSFSLDDIDRTLAVLNFRGVGEVLGFNGLQLWNTDLYRSAPFDPTISIPSGGGGGEPPDLEPPADEGLPEYMTNPAFGTLVQDYRDAIADIPLLQEALDRDFTEQGSNWWIVDGSKTDSGFPMIANDPHLPLGSPSTFYELHLNVTGGINVAGVSFPGAPGLVLGCNDVICWGATVNGLDATDLYNEVLVPLGPDPFQPTHTLFQGVPEPLQFIPQTFLFNAIGDGVPNTLVDAGIPADSGGVTIIVPRRNNGAIVQVIVDLSSPTPITGLSVQYVGASATQELETFRRFARASTMQEFKDALQYFDHGSQNWAYADINGNIAYYTSGELPIREDLQFGFFPDGLQPPYIIRDGTNDLKHEWLPVLNPQPNQALGNEILPFAEMPQVENPPSGYILNANNDPIGTTLDNVPWDDFRVNFNGRLYLAPGYAPGYRMGRIQKEFDEIFAGGGTLSLAESIGVGANNQLLDAEVLTPYLLDAFANATAPGAAPELTALVADARIGEAIGRLAAWDFSTPTGIIQGFDPGDNPLAPVPPSQAEIDASVAATIYSMWRGQILQRVIDGTLASLPIPLDEFAPGSSEAMKALRRLLDNYDISGGTGAGLINFFVVPGVPEQDTARDLILLGALQSGLDLLASDEFAPAFDNSTNQEDYRWGKLHRIIFSHFLGLPFSIPPPGAPENLAPDLPGISRAGGMGAVDASSHSARADGLNEFMFSSGPSRRMFATMAPTGPQVAEVIPGGESGLPGSPQQTDQLFLWLVNALKPLPISLDDVNALAVETQNFDCGDGVVGPGEQCDDGGDHINDGCNEECRITPIVTCNFPTVSADPETCDASIDCAAIASCADPEGGAVTTSCDPAGPYALGTTTVDVTCSDGTDVTVFNCEATVVDDTPPTISVEVDPDTLWPPNHKLDDVVATVTATDVCSGANSTILLESVTSDEPDDADGNGDGNTDNDIQGADVGTADFEFQLRAERAGGGDGRTYTVTYIATDGAGNQTSGEATVSVPHDQGGVTDPLTLSLAKAPAGTSISWTPVPEAQSYNVIRSNLADLTVQHNRYALGPVTCIEGGSIDETTQGFEDDVDPASGQVFVYMVEYKQNGNRKAYGTVSAGKPRTAGAGDCQ